jgi:hypothetical protein
MSSTGTYNDKREDAHRLSEAEAASLKKDADIYPANKNPLSDSESEEEYLRRRKRENDRRD